MFAIDLNSDIGESFGIYRIGNDAAILEYVTSVNIACGFHAGDPKVMHKTVEMAIAKGVNIGAQPGLPDLIGFGRRNISISSDEAYDIIIYQIGALYGFVNALGGQLAHVKPHGALYNMAATSPQLSDAIAKAVYDFNPQLILYGLAGSEMVRAGKACGLKVMNEVFADRTYQADGTLTPRTQRHWYVKDEETAFQQVLSMIKDHRVLTLQEKNIRIQADTVCVHGDNVQAVAFAKRLREGLDERNIKVVAP